MDFQLPDIVMALYLHYDWIVDGPGTIRYKGDKIFSIAGDKLQKGCAVWTGIEKVSQTSFVGAKFYTDAEAAENAKPATSHGSYCYSYEH
jgi:hypothetical protein